MAVSAGTAQVSLGLPDAPHLAGLPFFVQGLVLDPPVNPLGLVATNAGAGILGAK
jgi:hypothetical protein